MHVHNYTQVCIRTYVYINARELGAFKPLSFEGNCLKGFFFGVFFEHHEIHMTDTYVYIYIHRYTYVYIHV